MENVTLINITEGCFVSGCFVPEDFVPLIVLTRGSTFCPRDVLSQGCFVPGHSVSGCCVSGSFVYVTINQHKAGQLICFFENDRSQSEINQQQKIMILNTRGKQCRQYIIGHKNDRQHP
jgi:hypothetical protein